jgi:hypothetical protein
MPVKNLFNFIKNNYPIYTIILIWFVFSAPYFLKGLVPFPSDYLVSFFPPWNAEYALPVKNNAMPDVISQIFPWKKITIDTWKLGQVPLWNPYAFSGTVQAGNYQSAVFSPVNLLFFVLPFIDAWSLMILIQPLLAGLFMFLYLQDEKVSRGGSLFGSLAFMFSGFIVVWMAYGTLGYALLFLPLIFWSINQVYRGQVKQGIWAGLGLAFSFLSGHFQISLYVLFLSSAYAFFKGLRQKPVFRILSIMVLIAGLGISALQIFPTLEAYQNSSRSTSFVKGEVVPWSYLTTFVAPDYYGNPVTRNDWFGHYAEWCGYIGAVPLFLALAAMIGSRRKRVLFFGGVALFSFLLAYDTPLTDLLFALRLPVISTSAASRILGITSFSLAILSGIGIDILTKNKLTNNFLLRFLASFGLIGLIFSVYTFFISGLTGDRLTVAVRNSVLPAAILSVFILMVLALAKWPKKASIFSGIIILLTASELLRFATKWMPFSPRAYVYPETGVLSYLEKNAGTDRVFGNFGGEIAGRVKVSQTEGYDAMYKGDYGRFLNFAAGRGLVDPARSVALIDRNGQYTKNTLDLLGVRYVVHRLSDGTNIWTFPHWNYPESFRSVYRDSNYEIFENLNAQPRVYLAGSYRVIPGEQKLLEEMFSKESNLGNAVLFSEKPEGEAKPGDGEVKILRYTPGKIVFQSRAPTPKIMFLSDVYDSGWRAAVDGEPTKILETNYIFRAVFVPAGEHQVIMTYSPDSFRNGLIISFVSLIGLIMIFIRKWSYLK